MDDNKYFDIPTPTLSLGGEAAAVAPELKLPEEKKAAPAADDIKLDESILTDEAKAAVDAFAEKIDITDSQIVMQYGAPA